MAKKKVLSLEKKLEEALIPKEEHPYEIPKNWEWVKLESITVKLTDGSHNPPKGIEKGYPMYSAKNVQNNYFDTSFVNRYISENDFKKENQRTFLESGDVLLTIVGTIGRSAVLSENLKATLQRSVAVLTPKKVESKFLMYYFLSTYAQELFQLRAKGTAQKGIYLKTLREFEFPLPSLAEQERIVAKVESMLDKVKQAKELISEARETFELRRASILHQAFTGELTKKWREENPVESGKWKVDSLLEKINVEKMAKWEEESKKAVEEGKRKPKKPVIKPVEDMKIPLEEQPYELPEGWIWVPKKSVFDFLGGGTPSKQNSDYWNNGDIHWASVKDIKGDYLDTTIDKITELGFKNSSASLAHVGELILITRMSPGKTILSNIETTINQDLKIIKHSSKVDKLYVHRFFQNNLKNIEALSQGSTVKGITVNVLNEMLFPLPSLAEQKEIIKRVEEMLKAEEKAKELLNMEIQIDLLEKSILSKAFRGELGTNDPNDESAMELLRRILEEKGPSQLTEKRKKTNTKKIEKEKTIFEIIKENKKIEINELIKLSTKSILEVQKELQILSKEGEIKISKKDYKTLLEVQSENN